MPALQFFAYHSPLVTDFGRSIINTELNGHKTQRLANTANSTFHGIESEAQFILRVSP